MRKLSQDGGDSTSITSGIENEMKKCSQGILKSTKSSIKRKVQNFSHESDDTANEPLLHKNKEHKELSEIERQSAKFLLSKPKTDYASGKGSDKEKLLADDKIEKPSISDVTGVTNALITNGLKDKQKVTSQPISAASIHNHMNTNVFNNPDAPKTTTIAKTQILVELDMIKPSEYSPSPVIFTTAKIHTDGKIQQMEPVQVTPVPILSTVESGVVKKETKLTEMGNTSQQPKQKKNIGTTGLVTQVASLSNLPEKHDVQATSKESLAANASIRTLSFGNNNATSDNKAKVAQHGSVIINNKSTLAQMENICNIVTEDSVKILSKTTEGDKVGTAPRKMQDSPQVVKANEVPKSVYKEFTKIISNEATSSIDRSNVDVNKNFQTQSNQDVARQMEAKTPSPKSVTSQPSTGTICNKGLNIGACAKEDKATIDSIESAKESKIGKGQESKIRGSKVKTPDKEQAVNIVKMVNSGKPISESQNVTKSNTIKWPANSTSYADATVPLTSRSSANKIPASEHIANSIKNTSTVKPSEILSTNKGNSVKAAQSSMSKTDSSSVTVKSSMPDKGSSMSSKTTGKEKNTHIKPSSDIKTPSNTPVTTSSGTISSIFPQATTNTKSATSISKAKPANSIIKPTASVPTSSLSKTSVKAFSSSVIPRTSTAEEASPIYKSNNVATVVSSISKPTTSASSSKMDFLSSSTSKSSTLKSLTSGKQSTSPSTVKTIISLSSATVPHDKISTKGASTLHNKPVFTQSSKPTAITLSPAPNEPNTDKITPSAKVLATTSVKPATKSSTEGEVKSTEDIKDSKASKA